MAELAVKFPYIFDPSFVVPAGTSKPELAPHVLEAGVTVSIAGVPVLPLSLPHGDHRVLAYRIGPIAYITDVKTIPDDAIAALAHLDARAERLAVAPASAAPLGARSRSRCAAHRRAAHA